MTNEEEKTLETMIERLTAAISTLEGDRQRHIQSEQEVLAAKGELDGFVKSLRPTDAPPAKRAYNRKPKPGPTAFEIMAAARNAAVGE